MSSPPETAPKVLIEAPPRSPTLSAEVWNLPNALTLLRIFLVPFLVVVLLTRFSGREYAGLAIFLVAAITDFFDGYIARKRNQMTRLGALLDPIADKLLMATAFVVLAYVKILPVWLAVLVISRDLFILTGSVLILLLHGEGRIRTTIISKANTVVQVFTVIYFLAVRAFPGVWEIAPAGAEATAKAVVVGMCALTTAISGLHYLSIGMRQITNE